MKVKRGVQPPNLYIFAAAVNVYGRLGILGSLRVTSGLEGKHDRLSGHYQLRALDFGTKWADRFDTGDAWTPLRVPNGFDIPTSKAQVLDLVVLLLELEIAELLEIPASTVYVKVHRPGTRSEHIHAQVKP